PCTSHFNAESPSIHSGLHCLLHSTSERNTAFQLGSNIVCYKLCIHVRPPDFHNVDLYLLTFCHIRHFLGHFLDLGPPTSDNYPRARRMDRNSQAIPSPLDDTSRNCSSP